tara:strand:+ start:410 stop:589 length:180 start_codon:yes stop_codon:yes gene_type:complete
MSKFKFQFVASPSPQYKAKGFGAYEPIEVDKKELDRIKSDGYAIEILSQEKPKKKKSKK